MNCVLMHCNAVPGSSARQLERRAAPAPSCGRLAAPQQPACCHQSSLCRLPRRRGCRPAAAGGSGGGADEGEGGAASAEAAFEAVQQCMELFASPRTGSRDLDAVIAFLPDGVIDRLIERKRSKREEQRRQGAELGGDAPQQQQQQQAQQGPARRQAEQAAGDDDDELSFDELVALAQPSDLTLDSFSTRGLLHAAPRSAAPLSSLRLGPDRFLQRYEVVAQSGEEMVLTFDMQLEECLQPKYRGLQVVQRWFLRGITGESAYPGDVPRKPEPCWGPEAVCMAQLEALQAGDAAGVFRFASPQNQAATGPVERFAQMLQSPVYRPLLEHQQAEILRSVQMQPEVAVMIVGVRSNIPTSEPGVTQRVVYSWTLRLQGEAAGDAHGCWLTESVQPL